MTKEQMKQYVREVLNESTNEPSLWAVEEWKAAKVKGYVAGFNGNGTDDRPQARPTREQVACMIVRAMDYDGTAIWDGSIADGFEGGTGTEADPYLIAYPSQLAYLARQVNNGNSFADQYLKMTNDIILNENMDDPKEWVPIGSENTPFAGFFDGGSLSVHNLYINNSKNEQGLFGTSTGLIQGVTIGSGSITANTNVGGVAGSAKVVINCSNYANISAKDHNAGGIAGVIRYGHVQNCKNYGKVTAPQTAGGVVGAFLGDRSYSIEECINMGTIVCGPSNHGGGILGYNDKGLTIRNCVNCGDVTGRARVGGIVGNIGAIATNSSVIENSYNVGNIQGTSDMGGIFGLSKLAAVTSCYYLDENASPNHTSARTSSQLKRKSTYQNWDFDTIWTIDEGIDYPKLRWMSE